jgi:dynein heavy chain
MLFYLKKAIMYIIVFAQRAISMAIRDLGFQNWSNQVEKVKQFYNQIMVRHGIMLVGPTGGGKTTIRSILQKALVLLPTISPEKRNDVYTGHKCCHFHQAFSG